ncbi:MAG: hypothetical protein V3V80_04615, partial [Dehalococcoidia bacterium]
AVSLWKKVADLWNKKYPDANAKVLTGSVADEVSLNKIYLLIWHDSPSAWGKRREEIFADAGMDAWMKEHQEKQYTVMGTMAIKLYNVAD